MMNLVRLWRFTKRKAVKTPVRLWFWLCLASAALLIACFGALGIIGYYINLLPSLYDVGFSMLPILDARFLFEVGLMVSLIFFLIGVIKVWHHIPAIFLMTGVWFIVRIAITSITILYPPPEAFGPIPKDLDPQTLWDTFVAGLSARRVLFFSGHTGLPFLGFLLFRNNKKPEMFTVILKTFFWPTGFMALYLLTLSATPDMHWIITLALIALALFIFRNRHVHLKHVCLVWSFLMAATVIVTREHWSVDVAGAYLITGGTFYLFRRVVWPFYKIFDRLEELDEQIKPDLEAED